MSERKETTAKEYLEGGKSLAAEGKLTEAIASYKQAIALNPNFLSAYHHLAETLITKIELNPNIPRSYYQLGEAFQKIGELDKAINAYSYALRLQPNLWDLYSKLGSIFIQQGKLEAAAAAYRCGLLHQPEMGLLHKRLGDTLQQLGLFDEALQSYRKVIEINPNTCWNYGSLARDYCGINQIDTTEKIVALTFDDGPQPPHTKKVLEVLDSQQVKATFFCVGKKIEQHPKIAKLTLTKGHEFGNHSYSHFKSISDSAELIKSEIEECDRLLRDLGVTGEIPFRPPLGRRNLLLLDILFEMKKPLIMWNAGTDDYRKENTAKIIANRVLEKVKPGSIIVLHDASLRAVEATSIIIKNLKAQGYCFKTVSEMISGARCAPYG